MYRGSALSTSYKDKMLIAWKPVVLLADALFLPPFLRPWRCQVQQAEVQISMYNHVEQRSSLCFLRQALGTWNLVLAQMHTFSRFSGALFKYKVMCRIPACNSEKSWAVLEPLLLSFSQVPWRGSAPWCSPLAQDTDHRGTWVVVTNALLHPWKPGQFSVVLKCIDSGVRQPD